jgi:hypothetical protein
LSTRAKSVETILKDAVAQLDLSYTVKDIEDLAKEGMAWLVGSDASNVGKILSLFAALLGFEKPQKDFGLNNTISYGVSTPGKNDDLIFGPLVLYRPDEHLKVLQSIATGQTSVEVTGDAVFDKLQANVLEQPGRALSV